MKTPEQQSKEAEEKVKDLNDRTVTLPLTKKQIGILNQLIADKKDTLIKLEVEKDKANALQRKENEIVDFALEFHGIKEDEIEQVNLSADSIIILKKKVEIPKEEKKSKEVKLKPIEKESQGEIIPVDATEENHK